MARVYEDKSKYLENRLQFQNLSKNANSIIKEFGVSLNFKGFVETMVSYMKMDDMTPISEVEEMMKCFNFWLEYLGDIKIIIFYYKNHFEIKSDSSTDEAKKIEYKNKSFILKNYERALQKQETLFRRAYKDISYQYEEIIKSYKRGMYEN